MFFVYIWRELRRRHRQALLTALGLAVGVGLVVAVTAYAGGVSKAQDQVLQSLYGVGTDISVTQTAKLERGRADAVRHEPRQPGPAGREVLARSPHGFARPAVDGGDQRDEGRGPGRRRRRRRCTPSHLDPPRG